MIWALMIDHPLHLFSRKTTINLHRFSPSRKFPVQLFKQYRQCLLWRMRILVTFSLLVSCLSARTGSAAHIVACNQSKYRFQYGCEKIFLPAGFCPACGIGPYNASDGKYLECSHTTNLETSPLCFTKFQQYVELNPCDIKRQKAIAMYQSADPTLKEQGRQILDYFHYAMCESACDCIPQSGANPQNRTMDATRGNCQGHLRYDTCVVFPDLKVLQLNGTAYINATLLEPVCPLIEAWFQTPDGQNFENVTHTSVDPTVQRFLKTAWRAQNVPFSSFWLECYRHEVSQGRIQPYPSKNSTTTFFETIRINAGNLTHNYTDMKGKLWLTDRYFVANGNASIYNNYLNIFQTQDDELYQTERNSRGPLLYEIPVPMAGEYNVTLGFSEIFFFVAGKRVFNVIVEDTLIYEKLDVLAVAGRARTPLVLQTIVSVTDGNVSIRLEPATPSSKPKISWIKVRSL